MWRQMEMPGADGRARLLWLIPVGVTFALTLSRAWRLPNDFAEAHWLLDYRFGFVKRGLAGEILSFVLKRLGTRPSATIIAAISIALLVGLSLVLLWTAWQLIRSSTRTEAATLVSLAFASSPFVVMSAHLIGYLDGIVILLTVGAVALTLRQQRWAAAATLSLAVLVHESAIFVGLPVAALALWTSGQSDGNRRMQAWRSVPLLLPIVTFIGLAASARFLRPDFQEVYSLHLMNHAFVGGDMHVFVPEWLTPGFAEHLSQQSRHFGNRLTSPPMLGLVMPTVLALLAWTFDACRIRVRSWTAALLIGAIFAPQLMHIVAWDTMRLWTYSIATAWLGAWILSRATGARGEVSGGVRALALLAIVMNAGATTFLLDNQADHYSLATRLGLFAPTMIAAFILFLRQDPANRSPAESGR